MYFVKFVGSCVPSLDSTINWVILTIFITAITSTPPNGRRHLRVPAIILA